MSKPIHACVMFGLCLVLPTYAFAGPRTQSTRPLMQIKLKYGFNRVDLDGDGNRDMVFIARRRNFNAHSFDIVSFYINEPGSNVTWHVAPFLRDRPEYSLRTSGGADCMLHDYRIYAAGKKRKKVVVLAHRDFSRSFNEMNTVRFEFYRLVKNRKGIPGEPAYYYKRFKTITAKKKYCDVNQALKSELGLEPVKRSPLLSEDLN